MSVREDELARMIAAEVLALLRARDGRSPATGAALAGPPPPDHLWDPPLARARFGPDGKFLPAAVSARHVHLSPEDVERLFGPGFQLTRHRWLSQPHQFAAGQTVRLVGPRAALDKVRILGPARGASQVEISLTDARYLGLRVPVRLSGDHRDTPGMTLEGPHGSITIPRGVIVAARHIHMHPDEAAAFGVDDTQMVRVRGGRDRRLVLEEVRIRVSPQFRLDMHIDTDEANAAALADGDLVELLPD